MKTTYLQARFAYVVPPLAILPSIPVDASRLVHNPYWEPACVSAASAAAKPATRRGSADLLQFPWEAKAQGVLLVINLWAGVGSLLVTLVNLGCRRIALTVEPNRCAAQCHATAFPQDVLMERATDVQVDMLDAVVQRRSVRAILVAGGLCDREGVLADWKQQIVQLQRLVWKCRQKFNVPVRFFFKNEAALSPHIISGYTTIVDTHPVECQAGRFGSRRRIFLLRGPRGEPKAVDKWKLPPSLTFESNTFSSLLASNVSYKARRVVPENFLSTGECLTLFDPKEIVCNSMVVVLLSRSLVIYDTSPANRTMPVLKHECVLMLMIADFRPKHVKTVVSYGEGRDGALGLRMNAHTPWVCLFLKQMYRCIVAKRPCQQHLGTASMSRL